MTFRTLYQPIIAVALICNTAIATPTTTQENSIGEEYANAYGMLAQSEMQRTDVPASITLAQGILESDFGRSELAINANNHFGVKSHKGWQGQTYVKMTEEVRNGNIKLESAVFRLYGTVSESYKDHSDCLASRSNYVTLFLANTTDYKFWAKGLQEAGYATDENYANKLIEIIERYQLQRFDKKDILATYNPYEQKKSPTNTTSHLQENIQTLEHVLYEAEMHKAELEEEINKKNQSIGKLQRQQKAFEQKVQSEIEVLAQHLTNQQALIGNVQKRLQTVEEEQRSMKKDPLASQFNSDGTQKGSVEIFPARQLNDKGVFYQSGRKATIAQEDRNLLEIALEYGIDYQDLLSYNDLDNDENVPAGYYIYLEPKANYVENKEATHQVKIGETVHTISQRYGIKANKLYQRNHIKKGEEPKIGEYLFLNKVNKDQPALKEQSTHNATNPNFGAGGANR